MKKVLSGIAIVAALSFAASVVCAQDAASGEKLYKAKCAACHGANAEGKPAMKSPSLKGKSADEIQKTLSTNPKHTALKSLTAADAKDLSAFLATVK